MTHDLIWAKNLLTAAQHIADEAYQRRAWFGIGPEVSSPNEMFNVLYDDSRLEEFLKTPPAFVSRETLTQLALLRDEMDFLEVDDGDAAALIDSEAWAKVRRIARTAAELLAQDLKPI